MPNQNHQGWLAASGSDHSVGSPTSLAARQRSKQKYHLTSGTPQIQLVWATLELSWAASLESGKRGKRCHGMGSKQLGFLDLGDLDLEVRGANCRL